MSILFYVYKNNVQIFTRGKGTHGRDISYIQKYINIDKKVLNDIMDLSNKYNIKIALRGELVIKKNIYK